ncbi:MAG: formylglycine-generating enzyme family protein [Gemmatimonadetes bacterium]|nr:formylglycine-generating enzyme family protein [Gemmatimonadota bacterium]MCY3612949.1 formylglycine-generating enzyme family protein [Gemmatimonadota bacterium]MCY3677030.1 formylglycine-generating enzyme family protein [Gemmatimonadota bacterium]
MPTSCPRAAEWGKRGRRTWASGPCLDIFFDMIVRVVCLAALAVASPGPVLAQDEAGARQEEPEDGAVFRDCAVCPAMVRVPAGAFLMGSPESESGRYQDEGPQRVVLVAAFAAGVHEVTFTEWEACVEAGGCLEHLPGDEGWGRADRPVINVNWTDAQAYVEWLSEVTGHRYRLLSEAEWEYAARAGASTARPWGETVTDACLFANGDYSALPCGDGHENTAPAGSFKPNAFGLYDLLGNVWEWTQDCWNEGYAGAPGDGRAWESGDCSARVLRGGSWYHGVKDLRVAYRLRSPFLDRSLIVGFRVARSLN